MSKAEDRMNVGVVSHIRDLLHVEKLADVVFCTCFAGLSFFKFDEKRVKNIKKLYT